MFTSSSAGDVPQCWMAPKYSKVVLFIIDALRADMVTLHEGACTTPLCRFSYNHMVGLQELVLRNASQCGLYVFEADPPTVTSQRLKGLTTGGLPTFIDVSSNFGSDIIHEDNLIDQLSGLGRR